jgi:hypothetical protein
VRIYVDALLTNDHFARLLPNRSPEPCGFAEWDACLSDPAYSPYLVREWLDKWKIDLVFTGFWIGEGRPKFFSVCVNPPLRCGDVWQFERFEEALEAHGRLVTICRREAEKEGGWPTPHRGRSDGGAEPVSDEHPRPI